MSEAENLARKMKGNYYNNLRIQKKIVNGKFERLAGLRAWIKSQEEKHGKTFPGTFEYKSGQLLLRKEDGSYGQLPHEYRQDLDLAGFKSHE